jgi:hypothetical protein
VDERGGELGSLLVAERQRLRAPVGDLPEAEALEPAGRRGAGVGMADAVQAGEVHEMVGDAHLRVQAALLGHVAEPRAGGGVDPLPVPADLAAVRLEDAEHDPHGGRLARAVGADEAEHLAGPDVEAEPVEGDGRPVAAAEVVEVERGAPGAQAGSPTQYSTAPATRPSCRS